MPVQIKTQNTQEQEDYTVIAPVVECSHPAKVNQLMKSLGTVRALTYNKFGSLKGWGLTRNSSPDKVIRQLLPLEQLGLDKCKKLHEWTVSDVINCIKAQQVAATHLIHRDIWRKYPKQTVEIDRAKWLEKNPSKTFKQALKEFPECEIELARKKLFEKLKTDLTSDKWLHRKFRFWYKRGHTNVRNQIVLHQQAYKCKRLSRRIVAIEIKSIGVNLKVKSRSIISGQIRIIRNEENHFEIHSNRIRALPKFQAKPTKAIGIDKGYTEAFYTSDKKAISEGLGKLLTAKTKRITNTNRNRYRLRSLGEEYAKNKQRNKQKNLDKHNLGYKVKSRKLQREKDTIRSFIRRDLRRKITEPLIICCEDLTQPIRGKAQSKAVNCKLNQWMKGELQKSLEKLAQETGSVIRLVNPAYTSQLDSKSNTLLGRRDGDQFIRYTGEVLQADHNASDNIRIRGTSFEKKITRFMSAKQVRRILIEQTVHALHRGNRNVQYAIDKGYLQPKFRAEALAIECELYPLG